MNDPAVTEKLSPITDTLAEQIYKIAYKDYSVINECERGVDNTTRVWWVQAESVLGFMNYYQKHPEKTEYFKAVQDIWEYIQTYMVDKRPGSEWFWDLDENKQPSDITRSSFSNQLNAICAIDCPRCCAISFNKRRLLRLASVSIFGVRPRTLFPSRCIRESCGIKFVV